MDTVAQGRNSTEETDGTLEKSTNKVDQKITRPPAIIEYHIYNSTGEIKYQFVDDKGKKLPSTPCRINNRTKAKYVYYDLNNNQHIITPKAVDIHVLETNKYEDDSRFLDKLKGKKIYLMDVRQIPSYYPPPAYYESILEGVKAAQEAVGYQVFDPGAIDGLIMRMKIYEAGKETVEVVKEAAGKIIDDLISAPGSTDNATKAVLEAVDKIFEKPVQFKMGITALKTDKAAKKARFYANDVTMASLLGAMLSTGYEDFMWNGGSISDGTPGESSTHKNGMHLDLAYLRIDKFRGPTNLFLYGEEPVQTEAMGWRGFAVERQRKFNEATKIFGWETLYGCDEYWSQGKSGTAWKQWHWQFEEDKWVKWHETFEGKKCNNKEHSIENCMAKNKVMEWCTDPNTPLEKGAEDLNKHSRKCKHIMDTDHVVHIDGHWHHIHLHNYKTKEANEQTIKEM